MVELKQIIYLKFGLVFNSHRVRVQWIQMSVVRLTREFLRWTGEDNGWTMDKEGSSCSLWILTTVEKKERVNELSHNSMQVPKYFTSTLITYCQGRNSYMLASPSRCIRNGLNPDLLIWYFLLLWKDAVISPGFFSEGKLI